MHKMSQKKKNATWMESNNKERSKNLFTLETYMCANSRTYTEIYIVRVKIYMIPPFRFRAIASETRLIEKTKVLLKSLSLPSS